MTEKERKILDEIKRNDYDLYKEIIEMKKTMEVLGDEEL